MSEQTITTEQISVKPCIKCGAMDRNSRGECRPCTRETARNWRNANLEKERERKREYLRKWRESDPERFLQYNRKWQSANREKTREKSKRYYKENPNKCRERDRTYREANSKKISERTRKWNEENPERRKVYHHNRKARIKKNGGVLSSNIVSSLLTLQKSKCACCGKSLKHSYHLDHIMPIALGGTNTDDNVQLLTPSCNLRKSAKHPDDWARENGRLL